MENLKKIIIKMFTAEPYSKKRFAYYNKLKELEKVLNVSLHHVFIGENAIKCQILKRVEKIIIK